MGRITILIVLIFCSFFVRAQQAGTIKNANSLKFNFPAPTLTAYQETAKNQIEDLYQYLQLLSDTTVSDQLKVEVTESVILLFKNKDVLVPVITSANKDLITLTAFITQIKNTHNVKFKVSAIDYGQIGIDSWPMTYSVELQKTNKREILNLTQIVYLTKGTKSFGNNVKQVWQLHLGAFQ